jgi:hypothetical protein
MNETSEAPRLAIDAADLRTIADVITMRFDQRTAEAQRAARMRTLVRVTADLSRTLSTYSRHALVNCQGTAGTSDFSADTERLSQALDAFCAEVRAVSSDYGAVIAANAAARNIERSDLEHRDSREHVDSR